MFIKGKGFYLALPLLVVVLAKMLHPILYVFLIFYFIFLYLKHFKILPELQAETGNKRK